MWNICIHLDPSTWLMGIFGYAGKWSHIPKWSKWQTNIFNFQRNAKFSAKRSVHFLSVKQQKLTLTICIKQHTYLDSVLICFVHISASIIDWLKVRGMEISYNTSNSCILVVKMIICLTPDWTNHFTLHSLTTWMSEKNTLISSTWILPINKGRQRNKYAVKSDIQNETRILKTNSIPHIQQETQEM